jgi:hypothetical protein
MKETLCHPQNDGATLTIPSQSSQRSEHIFASKRRSFESLQGQSPRVYEACSGDCRKELERLVRNTRCEHFASRAQPLRLVEARTLEHFGYQEYVISYGAGQGLDYHSEGFRSISFSRFCCTLPQLAVYAHSK